MLAMTPGVGRATHDLDEESHKQHGKFVLADTYNPDHVMMGAEPTTTSHYRIDTFYHGSDASTLFRGTRN